MRFQSAPPSAHKKQTQLGMPHGTAMARLKKQVLFRALQKSGDAVCFRCREVIETVEELSIDHKTPWLDASPALFWDLDNVAFSHLTCNTGAGRKLPRVEKHGTVTMYMRGCRCASCVAAKSKYRKEWEAGERKA